MNRRPSTKPVRRTSSHVARAQFKARAHAWTERIGVQPRRLQVQAMRRKWASCSTAGTVTFSVDLLREPGDFQDVVIVHELLHLNVPNHGRLFRSLMKAYVPEWERIARGRTSRSCGFQILPVERDARGEERTG
jgi:predicted metal-dependent hydrolase